MLHLHYKFDGKEKELSVQFEYTPLRPDMPSCRDTVATIELPSGQKAQGYAQLHHRDSFRKAIGRKIAFSRALKELDFSQPERTAIWEAFFQKVKRDNHHSIPLVPEKWITTGHTIAILAD